jgi:hypothetical protein
MEGGQIAGEASEVTDKLTTERIARGIAIGLGNKPSYNSYKLQAINTADFAVWLLCDIRCITEEFFMAKRVILRQRPPTSGSFKPGNQAAAGNRGLPAYKSLLRRNALSRIDGIASKDAATALDAHRPESDTRRGGGRRAGEKICR